MTMTRGRDREGGSIIFSTMTAIRKMRRRDGIYGKQLKGLSSTLLGLGLVLWLSTVNAQKVAVIGGGVSGTFVTRYLVDYDKECSLDSITVFEAMPVNHLVETSEKPDDDWQGSRVTALKLEDDTVIELGASIGYSGFHLVLDMIHDDPNLEVSKPFTTGSGTKDKGLRSGLGIYNGSGEWPLLTSTLPSFLRKLLILYRYNSDLLKVDRMCTQSLKSFAKLPSLLASEHPDTFFDSPDDIWQAIGLIKAVHSSFDQLLDVLGVSTELSGIRKWLPYQGSLRTEFLTAINLVNYNQDNSQVNGMVGLGSFAAGSGDLFSIKGGNYQIIQSALQQAMDKSEHQCNRTQVEQLEKRVTTVVGGLDGLSLYSEKDLLGVFDSVILAAPLQQSRIQFLVKSHFDDAVLQPMPLAGLVNAHDNPTDEGNAVFSQKLPESATRSYTQVVTTVVSNATLSADYFVLPEHSLPRAICMTVMGKRSVHNITAITQIKSSGVYKVFSSNKLDEKVLVELFGPYHTLEYVKSWGGPHGGATPDYQGQGTATNFLLYDGAAGLEGHTYSGSLYYPPAMEQSSLACMELSAVGARAVAKLVARRLGLIKVEKGEIRDEL